MGALLRMLIAATAMISAALAEDVKPSRVLLVTGVDHPGYNWQLTAPAILEFLSQENRFALRIIERPDLLASSMIFDYDVVFLYFRHDKPLAREQRVRRNLATFANQGGAQTFEGKPCEAH